MLRSLSLFLCVILLSCNSDGYGLDNEVFNIVIPREEIVNVQSSVIAHRGGWYENGLPENSLAAFKEALGMDIYGSECDVRQTKDKQLVICHDPTHDGLSISKSSYATLSQHLLDNGEPLPLLDNFLEVLSKDTGRVRLVLDLKSCSMTTLLNMISSFGVLDRVDFISNKEDYCAFLEKYSLGYKTFPLGGSLPPMEVKKKGYGGIDYPLSTFQTHPEWIAEAQDYGLQVWTWTANNEGTIKKYLKQGVYVTTDYPARAREIEKQLSIER